MCCEVLILVNTYQPSEEPGQYPTNYDDYYSAEQVAQIEGVKKEAILKRCRLGKYPGAFKTPSSPEQPSGKWYIPKAVIGPTASQDVAILTKSIAPADLERLIMSSTLAAVEPLREEVNQLRKELENHYRRQDERMREIMNNKPKKTSLWSKIFG